MRFAAVLLMPLLLVTPLAQALDAACEPFVAASEKSSRQPARHSVSEVDGDHAEQITIDGKSYMQVGGKWRELKMDLAAAEKKLNADVRSGKTRLKDCKSLGSQTMDGVATTAIAYTLVIEGAPPASATAYVDKDGLIHAVATADSKVTYRYTGVSAPKL